MTWRFADAEADVKSNCNILTRNRNEGLDIANVCVASTTFTTALEIALSSLRPPLQRTTALYLYLYAQADMKQFRQRGQ